MTNTMRRWASVALAVAFTAMAISGILMMILGHSTLGIGMHPVHEIFGILMAIAGGVHVALNLRQLATYLRSKALLYFGLSLALVMALLFGLGLALGPHVQAEHQALGR